MTPTQPYAREQLAATDSAFLAKSLASLLTSPAKHFSEVRVGLNHMADRLMCLEKQP